ncbi:hypothetical protein SAMN04488035_2469 [Flavimobilis marinus]|uniref:Uncharacterized protein n=1 Tax=Flavimobilis marinus TaxID=285351 RepID=A0A1I2HUK3_9MICO|nr:hypothetical protein [Flavimobilis marinus]SFF32417.1 hypothetical protein SAMN04488035_2469 [Flavimobilis marinus]
MPSRGSWIAITGLLVLALAAAGVLAGLAGRRETRLPRSERRTTMER